MLPFFKLHDSSVIAHLSANNFLVSTAFYQQPTPGTLIFISIIERAFVNRPKRCWQSIVQRRRQSVFWRCGGFGNPFGWLLVSRFTIPMSNNPPKKLPPHILAAGDTILCDLDLLQKALDDLFDKNGALNFDKDVTANISQAMPTPQPASRRRSHFTPPPPG